MASVAVAGSLACDLVFRLSRRPAVGETVIATGFDTFVGGKGCNQAIAAARSGARVTMIGRIGVDRFGEVILAKLAAAGIRSDYVAKDPEIGTGIADIHVDESGHNSIVVAPRANARLCEADIDAAAQAISSAGVLLLQLEVPMDAVIHAARIAKRSGVRTILNPAPAPLHGELPRELVPLIDVLVPNQSEASLLTGLPAATQTEAIACLRALKALGFASTVVTMADLGSMWLDGETPRTAEAFTVEVVDTTAAGDAFCGALAASLAEGESLEDAISFASAAGALACTALGAEPSLPVRSATLELRSRRKG